MEKEILIYYNDPAIGRVELWETPRGLELYINGGLQFCEKDEYRYHQTVFLLPLLMLPKRKRKEVLVLGGGDGLGVRELLRLPDVKEITVVDISKLMTDIVARHSQMKEINLDSFSSPRVKVINEDGYEFVKEEKKRGKKYDAVILDYPDPSIKPDDQVNRLFSSEHYKDIYAIVKENGIISLQATSVIITPNVFRRIVLEISKVFPKVYPLKCPIPSFGDIGVVLARKKGSFKLKRTIKGIYFTPQSIKGLEVKFFHEDEKPTTNDEVLLSYPIYELVKWDFNLRPEEISEIVEGIYKQQIKSAEEKNAK